MNHNATPAGEPSQPTVFRADQSTIRWNFPAFAKLEDFGDDLISLKPVDIETRQRNIARGSLFEVLVEAIVERIDDRPVYVEFSGGCDSSVVLAASVQACRHVGHDLPIPLTFRFPLLPETDESDYQDVVLTHLGLDLGRREMITSEFDLLGPAAQRGLRELGVVWPAPAVATSDPYRELEPGLMLSGEGGDEVMGPRRIAGIFRARDAARKGQAKAVGGNLIQALGPEAARRRLMLRDGGLIPPWIEENEAANYIRQSSRLFCREPLRPSQFGAAYSARPNVWLALHQITAIAAWAGQTYAAPLMDMAFVEAVNDLTPTGDLRNRFRVMRRHFGDYLPTSVVNRIDKRYLQGVYFNDYAREFARHWDGQINDDLVDSESLRQHWRDALPSGVWGQSFLLLQLAWLQQQDV